MKSPSLRPIRTGSQEQPRLELLAPLETPAGGGSPHTAARVRRQLTVEEVARRSGLTTDQVTWLESGRVYAFRTPEDALTATVLLCAALEIDLHTAREVAGLPTRPRSLEVNPRGRLTVVVALLAVTAVIAAASGYFLRGGGPAATTGAGVLPPPSAIAVPVLNGGGDVNFARRIAGQVQALGYAVPRVERADTFRYPDTAVYYGPDAKKIGARLAGQLCLPLKPLGSGARPGQVLVITGPPTLFNC
jgi:transcriptional regulator with XRE-family HTH domain